MDTSLKRIVAYIIDIAIVTLIVTLISSISFINPYKKEYNTLVISYQELVKETKDDEKYKDAYHDKIVTLNYEIAKANKINGTITIIVFLLYFGLYNYLKKGKTIGKKIMHLQLTRVNDKKNVSFMQCIIRTVVLNNIIFRIMLIVGSLCLASKAYFSYSQIISFIESLIETSIFAMIILRKDNRGLHDIIARTKVIMITPSEVVEQKNTKK